MDNLLFYKLVGEVKQQCRFGELAFKNLRALLQSMDSEKIFFNVYALLHHALRVSDLLWPSRAESRERGEQLRKGLGVGDASPLRLAAVREQLGREDEQLEDWAAGLENKNYVDMNVMAQGTMAGFKEDNFHRSLDPENFKLRLRGVNCDLRQLSDELHKVETVAETWLRTRNPW